MRKKVFFILSLFCCINYALGEANTNTTLGATTSTDKQDKVIEQPIEILNGWSTIPFNGNLAAYLVIKNNSNNDYTLIRASALEAANDVEIHQIKTETIPVNGGTTEVVSMVPITQIGIAAGDTVTLGPQGIHIMLHNIKYNMKVGTKFKLYLTFRKGTEIDNTIVVPCDIEVKELNYKQSAENPSAQSAK